MSTSAPPRSEGPEPDTPRILRRPEGLDLAYRLWSPGPERPLLVLLHGVASNLSRWSEFVATTTLRDSWALLRMDLRGHGGSVHRGRLGMREWVDDLAAVLDAEGCRHAVVGGHCLGANIALGFASRRPDRTAGLVLIEPMVPGALRGSLARIAALRPLFRPLTGLVRGLNRLGCHRRRLLPLDLSKLDRDTRAAIAAGGAAETLLARYASPWLDLRTTPVGAYLQGLVTVSDPLPDVAAIRAPALGLVATGSRFTDPAGTERALAGLPRVRIVKVDARHWIPTEQPLAMRGAIEAWCEELRHELAGTDPHGSH